ncbi:MAG: hypothetical protein OER04_05665 [Cyclobacteriaceae bacterium]|nr:hypothetical protein [Cyclobacteriaceae bacterium]
MTDKSLDQLIASLKTEAIEQAEKESATILEEAETRAHEILAAAEAKKNSLIMEAKKEAQAIVDEGQSALKVAARDLSISVRNQLLELFRKTFEAEVRDSFGPDLIRSVITRVIENVGTDVELRLPNNFMKELSEYIHEHVATASSISIIQDSALLEGLSIVKKDQGWSYDISPEQVMEAVMPQLNAKWIQILTDQPSA